MTVTEWIEIDNEFRPELADCLACVHRIAPELTRICVDPTECEFYGYFEDFECGALAESVRSGLAVSISDMNVLDEMANSIIWLKMLFFTGEAEVARYSEEAANSCPLIIGKFDGTSWQVSGRPELVADITGCLNRVSRGNEG